MYQDVTAYVSLNTKIPGSLRYEASQGIGFETRIEAVARNLADEHDMQLVNCRAGRKFPEYPNCESHIVTLSAPNTTLELGVMIESLG